jgi:hypothetical protein
MVIGRFEFTTSRVQNQSTDIIVFLSFNPFNITTSFCNFNYYIEKIINPYSAHLKISNEKQKNQLPCDLIDYFLLQMH